MNDSCLGGNDFNRTHKDVRDDSNSKKQVEKNEEVNKCLEPCLGKNGKH